VTQAAAFAESLITEIHTAGGTIRWHGNRIRIAAHGPLSPDLVTRYRAARPELYGVLAAPAEKADWHARYGEALAHWRPLHPGEAKRIAWGEMQNRWHRLYGARVPEWQCAGCGAPIGGVGALLLGDGARTHFDTGHGLDCLIDYGHRWRGAATRALAAMGLQPPAEDDDRCERSPDGWRPPMG
jgi:hypothetical protein